MYERHPTSVIHPVPTPQIEKIPNVEQFAFNSDGSPATNMDIIHSNSKMEVPVTFGKTIKDATLSSYESPELKNQHKGGDDTNFIEKKAKSSAKSKFEQTPEEALTYDIDVFTKQFDNTKDKQDKLKIVAEGKKRILQEAKDLKETIINDISELLEGKKMAIRLNNAIQRYEKKLIEDQEAQRLRLGDEIGVKAALKARLQKEVQGIRIAPEEFKELMSINPEDIERITQEVVAKLNGGS